MGRWRGEEFLKEYNGLPPSPKKGSQLREREPTLQPPLRKLHPPSPSMQRGQNNNEKKKRGKWSDQELRDSINALDCGYKYVKLSPFQRALLEIITMEGLKEGKGDLKQYLPRRKMTS